MAPLPNVKMRSVQVPIPKEMMDKVPKIMEIETDSVPCERCIYPRSILPFNAYGLSSQKTFEFARFEKPKATRDSNELIVYQSEFKYSTDSGDNIRERIIGKVSQHHLLTDQLEKVIDIYKYLGNNKFGLIYRLRSDKE